jgi:hypothetical protein
VAVAVSMVVLPESRGRLGLGLVAPAGIAVIYLVRRLFQPGPRPSSRPKSSTDQRFQPKHLKET